EFAARGDPPGSARRPGRGRARTGRHGGGLAAMIDLSRMTARTIAAAVRRRELTAVAVTQAALGRIDQLNATLHAFITVTRDEAMAAAEQVDRKVAAGQGDTLPLAGVPLAIKDSFWTKGVRTTGGTKVLAGFVPAEDASVVARLKGAGC